MELPGVPRGEVRGEGRHLGDLGRPAESDSSEDQRKTRQAAGRDPRIWGGRLADLGSPAGRIWPRITEKSRQAAGRAPGIWGGVSAI